MRRGKEGEREGEEKEKGRERERKERGTGRGGGEGERYREIECVDLCMVARRPVTYCHYITQTDLGHLGSSDPPTSAF